MMVQMESLWPDLDTEQAEMLRPTRREQWLRLLFPARCVLCDAVVPMQSGLLVCEPCHGLLEPEESVWRACPEWPEIDAWYSPFPYAGGVEQAIRNMKYNGRPGNAETLSFLLAEAIRRMEDCPEFAGIIPVPMHHRKERARGYNQAVILAEGLGRYFEVPVFLQAVEKHLHTISQNGLNRHERFSVLEGSFSPYPGGSVPAIPRILLVDDVVTTGSTLRACASAIRKAYGETGQLTQPVLIHAVTIAFA